MIKSRKLKEYKLIAIVTLKSGVLDPQGKAIGGALKSIDIAGFNDVRQGKLFETAILATSKKEAKAKLLQACEKLLANTIVENYRILGDK
jgi:phosphoribosylformylglycinamidine synthase